MKGTRVNNDYTNPPPLPPRTPSCTPRNIPVETGRRILEDCLQCDPERLLSHNSLRALARTAETLVPMILLGPSRSEHMRGETGNLPDSYIAPIVYGDINDDYRRHLVDRINILIERRGVSEKTMARIGRDAYAHRVAVTFSVELSFPPSARETNLSSDDIDALKKFYYWNSPHHVPCPRMSSADTECYAGHLSAFSKLARVVEAYLFYMRPPNPGAKCDTTARRLAMILVYVSGLCKLMVSLFEAADQAILRAHGKNYNYNNVKEGTMPPAIDTTSRIRDHLSYRDSVTLAEALLSSISRVSSLVTRWHLINVSTPREVKQAAAAVYGLASLINGHVQYILNLTMTCYVYWLPGYAMDRDLVSAVGAHETFRQYLCQDPVTGHSRRACSDMLPRQPASEWRTLERGTTAWVIYTVCTAYERALLGGEPARTLSSMKTSIDKLAGRTSADISDVGDVPRFCSPTRCVSVGPRCVTRGSDRTASEMEDFGTGRPALRRFGRSWSERRGGKPIRNSKHRASFCNGERFTPKSASKHEHLPASVTPGRASVKDRLLSSLAALSLWPRAGAHSKDRSSVSKCYTDDSPGTEAIKDLASRSAVMTSYVKTMDALATATKGQSCNPAPKAAADRADAAMNLSHNSPLSGGRPASGSRSADNTPIFTRPINGSSRRTKEKVRCVLEYVNVGHAGIHDSVYPTTGSSSCDNTSLRSPFSTDSLQRSAGARSPMFLRHSYQPSTVTIPPPEDEEDDGYVGMVGIPVPNSTPNWSAERSTGESSSTSFDYCLF